MTAERQTQYEDVESWELSDSMWERIAPLLPKPKSRYRGRGSQRRHMAPKRATFGGRPAADARKTMSGIMYVMRTGCQWNALPKEYGAGKTPPLRGWLVHRYFQKWTRAGVFKRMWQAGLVEYDQTKGIVWTWQAVDGTMIKAPLGGQETGPNPTDRAKSGTKRSVLVDAKGVPLGLVISGANTPDATLLEPTLWAKRANQIEPTDPDTPQNLCLDKGYSGEPCQQVVQTHGYELHIPDKANAKKSASRVGAKRGAGLMPPFEIPS